MPGSPIKIGAEPGVKRDGTELEGAKYIEAQWCRFRRGFPRKMGGERAVTQSLVGPVYSMYSHTDTEVTRVYFGSSNALEFSDLDTRSGIGGSNGDRLPTSGYVPNDQNLWTFDELYDGGGTMSVLLAHAAPNLGSITSTDQRKVFFGDITASTPLIDTTCPEVSGGIFAAAPYAIAYDNDGTIYWCVPNTPDDWVGAGSGDARVTRSKIIFGARVRGGAGSNPSFLLWTTNSLIRATFIGGTAVWDFDEVAGNISVLSSRCITQINGVFYWIGNGTFNVYNGVVQEIPNDFNRDWFFDNINRNQLQKIWGNIYPAKGEIRWHAPFADSSVCDKEIIFNYQQNIWYDNRISRSVGVIPDVMEWPLWMSEVDQSAYSYTRPKGGVASSSAGTAANAFDGDLATNCLAGVNGNIIYDYGDGCSKEISRVGINVQTTGTFDLIFEYCNDTGSILTNWAALTDPISQSFTASTDYYFNLPEAVQVRAIRVRETGGGTLDAREVYFLARGFMLFQQEFGLDRIIGNDISAIESYFVTADFSLIESGKDCWTNFLRMEYDFIQEGQMSVEFQCKRYARSDPETKMFTFEPDTQKQDITLQGRISRMKFTSNTQGGDYELGQTYLFISEGDQRQ